MLYKIIGADGKEYGPVTEEMLRQWIAQGRVNAQTRTLSENATDWQPLGSLTEFLNSFAVVTPTPLASTLTGTVRKTNGFATGGLICGIVSILCCCGFPINILGIIFSMVALSQINRQPEIYEGCGMAIAGLVLSIVSIVLFVVLLLINIASGGSNFHWSTNGF
ncbi:MAG TPA: DUF4190 domain-containing protein [Candidatus Baltobacteraceae bacterium]|nr:DUF4190 domain-containing protein [Candidatus Baltobacteraceae bacterium]